MLSRFILPVLPEYILLAGILVLMTLEMFRFKAVRWNMAGVMFLLGALAAAAYLPGTGLEGVFMGGSIALSPAIMAGKSPILLLTMGVFLIPDGGGLPRSKQVILTLSAVLGLLFMISANDLIILFIGFELMAIPLYVLILDGTAQRACVEAAIKYILTDGAVTAMWLMGVALMYCSAGTLGMNLPALALAQEDVLSRLGCLLFFGSFFIKLALAPFHLWSPDVLQGTSTRVMGLISAPVKAALVLVLWRVTVNVVWPAEWVAIIVLVSLLSVIWGNLAMYHQQSFRRLLAYSSVSNMGFVSLALLLPSRTLFISTLLYFMLYGPVLLAGLIAIEKLDLEETVNRWLRDDVCSRPASVLLLLFLLSSAALPPFPGFFAKLAVVIPLFRAGYGWVAVAVLVAGFLGLYAYLRVAHQFFNTDEEAGGSAAGKAEGEI